MAKAKDKEPAAVPAGTYTEEQLDEQLAEAMEQEPAAAADPLRPAQVKNHGTAAWVGSDYAPVGPGVIEGGTVGTVTWQKAQDLVNDFGPEGRDGKGPFEIVVEG